MRYLLQLPGPITVKVTDLVSISPWFLLLNLKENSQLLYQQNGFI